MAIVVSGAQPLDAELLARLESVRSQFGAKPRAEKIRLLEQAASRRFSGTQLLRDYHDLLLYLVSHPGDPRQLAAAEGELTRIARFLATGGGERCAASTALIDSGISGTTICYSYSLPALRWLSRRFANDVDLVISNDSVASDLGEFLGVLLPPVARDGLAEDDLTLTEWIERAKGDSKGNTLGWLMVQIDRLRGDPAIAQRAWDALEMDAAWHMGEGCSSRTFTRFPQAKRSYFQRNLVRRPSLRRVAAVPLPRPRRLTRDLRRDLLDACRTSGYVRCRETEPLNFASTEDVTLFELDRGVAVALIGIAPASRPPLESFIGFVAAKNGVPVAYGGGWLFFDRCGIGVNVFPEFRGGESAYVFAQVARVYAQHLGARRFHVDPYQLGSGNLEAIASGAFWFYQRLGFRPVEPALARIAADEARLIAADRRHRTEARVLRLFAESEVALELAPGEPIPEHTAVSSAITAHLGRRYAGDYDRASRAAAARMKRVLGLEQKRAGAASRHFATWSLVADALPDLESWPDQEKRSFARFVAAKSGPLEKDSITALQRCHRLRRALLKLVSAE